MNTPLSIEQLKRIKGIMHAMLAEANNANWQELARLDSERRVMIDYQERASSKPNAFLEASTGAQPHPDQNMGSERQAPELLRAKQLTRSSIAPANHSARADPDSEYLELSADLAALDKEITATVNKARHALLEETRCLRAQVSAKKSYEQANTMKVSSYS